MSGNDTTSVRKVLVSHMQVTLTGLRMYTQYEVTLLAFNAAGDGPNISQSLAARTNEGGKCRSSFRSERCLLSGRFLFLLTYWQIRLCVWWRTKRHRRPFARQLFGSRNIFMQTDHVRIVAETRLRGNSGNCQVDCAVS